MAVAEFDDSRDFALFIRDSQTLRNGNGYAVRWSELTLAALRAAGALDNMIDGITAPTTDKLWLDKNEDPAVLKRYDSAGTAWVAVTFDWLFGRGIFTELDITGGTSDAIVVAAPATFVSGRLYSLTPTGTNTGAVTIQVSGVGTYSAVYGNGGALVSGELEATFPRLFIFQNGRFELIGATANAMRAAVYDGAGVSLDIYGGRAEFLDRADAAAATISASIGKVVTQFYAAADRTPYSGARYCRTSFADLTGISSRLYFRSADRFMPDGTTDGTNGGYWLIDEKEVTPQMAGAIATGDSADLTENTAAWIAVKNFGISSGTPIYAPPGVYCVNARPNPPQNTGLIHLTAAESLTIRGVPGASILRNVADDPFALVSVQGGNNITIDGLELDINRQNVTGDNGHGVVIYNVAAPINRLRLRNLILRNCRAYGIGLQSAPVIDGLIENCSFLSNGNDAIDIKPSISGASQKRALFLKNLYADSVDQLGAGGKAAFDIRGYVLADGLYCDGLTSAAGQPVTGIRMNTEVTALDRDGSKRSRLSNFIVTCADGTTEQTTFANSNIGVQIAERDVALVNGHIEGFGSALQLTGTGDNDSPPIGDAVTNLTIKGARTGDGAGRGVTLGGSGAGYHRVSAHVENCDIGVVSNSGTHQGEFTIINCTTAHTISAAVFALSHFRFIFNGNGSDGSEGSLINFANSVAVYDGTTASLNLENTKNDSAWSGPVGQLQFKSKDTSGPGAGVRAAVRARMSGGTGADTFLSLTASGSTTGLDQEVMQIWDRYVVMILSKVGNYADDAAAAAGGIPVGAFYRTGSALKIRVS